MTRRKGNRHLLAVWVGTLVLATSALMAAPTPQGWDPGAITLKLRSSDLAVRNQGLEQVREYCRVDPADGAKQIKGRWGQVLIETKQEALAAELALAGVVAVPQDTDQVEDLLKLRVRALLQTGQAAEALQAAKSLFNVSRSGHTAEALATLASCLEKARPENSQMYKQFQEEQTAGAALEAGSYHSAILAEVKVDASPYDKALATFKDRDVLDTNQIRAYGNLLLLADRGTEARKIFNELDLLDDPALATECIARAIRAEDGVIGRANRYLLGKDK